MTAVGGDTDADFYQKIDKDILSDARKNDQFIITARVWHDGDAGDIHFELYANAIENDLTETTYMTGEGDATAFETWSDIVTYAKFDLAGHDGVQFARFGLRVYNLLDGNTVKVQHL